MNQHRQKQIYLLFGNQDLLVQENAEKCINDLLETANGIGVSNGMTFLK